MNEGNFKYFIHVAIPDADWESFQENSDILGKRVKKQVPTGGKTYLGHPTAPPGALIRFIPTKKGKRYLKDRFHTWEGGRFDEPSPPVVVFEWVEYLRKDLIEPDDVVGCEPWAKILYRGLVQWVYVNFDMYSVEVISK